MSMVVKIAFNLVGNVANKMNEYGRSMERFADKTQSAARRASAATSKIGNSLFSNINFSDLDRRIDRAERRLANARSRLMDGLAMGAMVAAPVVKIGKFEHQLVHFGNIANKTREELDAIETDIREKAQRVNQHATDMLSGLDYLLGKGLSDDEGSAAIEAIGKTATATNSAINDMSRAGFAVIDNLNVAVSDLSKSFDIMAQAGKRGGFELKDMASHYPKLTASARSLGIEGVEGVARLSAALQIAIKGAGSPEEAANNFNNFLSKIASPETVSKFKKLGIDIRKELDNAAKNGVDPMEYMIVRMHDLAEENPWVIGDLFGDMQVQQFLKPIIANLEEYRDIRDDAMQASGVVDKDFEKVMDTQLEKWKAFTIELDRALEHGKGFANTIGKIVTQMTNLLALFNDFATANPELANALIHLVGGFLALGAVLTLLNFAWALTGLQVWRTIRALGKIAKIKIDWKNIKPLKWASKIGKIAWATLLTPLKWANFIPKLNWSSALGLGSKLSWRLLIKPLVWFGKFIPVIGWALLAADIGIWSWDLIIKPLGWDKYLGIDSLRDRLNSIKKMFGMTTEHVDEISILPKWPEATQENIDALKHDLDMLNAEISDIRSTSQNQDAADMLARPKEIEAGSLKAQIEVLEQKLAENNAQSSNTQQPSGFEPIPAQATPTFEQLQAFVANQPPAQQQFDQSKHVTQTNQFNITVHGAPAVAGHQAYGSVKAANERALADTD